MYADRLVVLKKPFDTIEVLQLADALTEKWRLAREDGRRLQVLEHRIQERNRDLQAIQVINAQLDAANKQLAAATRRADATTDTQIQRHRALELELRHALQASQLTVHYQPLVDIASRRIVSLEAAALAAPAARRRLTRRVHSRRGGERVDRADRRVRAQGGLRADVSAILAMTRSLGLRAVAEGVETPAQLEVLGRHGCGLAQGFYFSRPLPADQCRELLLDLAQRSSFTDTLRMRLLSRAHDAPLHSAATRRVATVERAR